MFSLAATADTSELSLGRLGLTITFTETDTLLKDRRVIGSIDWGDGSPAESLGQMTIDDGSETTSVSVERGLAFGTHTIIVSGQNYRYPDPDTDSVILIIERSRGISASEVATPRTVSVGPILPRDIGEPNPQQWQFDIGKNLLNIESAVKLLLTTQKGERLHMPDFGTNISQFVFEPNDSTLASLVREDINQAIERYAPFAAIQAIKIVRDTAHRTLNVEIRFVNQAMGQQLSQVNLSFER